MKICILGSEGQIGKHLWDKCKTKNIEFNSVDIKLDVEAMIASEHFIGTLSSCVGQFVNVKRQCQKSSSIDYNFYFD